MHARHQKISFVLAVADSQTWHQIYEHVSVATPSKKIDKRLKDIYDIKDKLFERMIGTLTIDMLGLRRNRIK